MNPHYQNLSAALDSKHLSVRIQQQLKIVMGIAVELEDFNAVRVFPRSGDSFTIQYRMNALNVRDGSTSPMILCGHLLGSGENLPNYVEQNKGHVLLFEDLRLVVPVFPYDPQLPAITDFCVAGQLPKIMQKVKIEGIQDLSSMQVKFFEVMGYRLERRCTIRHDLCESSRPSKYSRPLSIVTKITKPGKMKETVKCLTLLMNNGFSGNNANALAIPRTYFIDKDLGIQISEFSPGQTLHYLTDADSFESACVAAAKLLKKLGNVDTDSLPEYGIQEELTGLGDKIEIVTSVFPELSTGLKSAFEKVESAASVLGSDFKRICIHRDFYDKQVLYSPNRTSLLDWDSLASGDPAQDCGNFAGHLILRGLQHPDHSQNIRKGLLAFESAYGISDDQFLKRKCWWQAATLMRLACLYSLRPKWHMISDNLANSAVLLLQTIQSQKKGVKEKYAF